MKKSLAESEVLQPLFRKEKDALIAKLAKALRPVAEEVVGKRAMAGQEITWELPAQPEHGDLATNLALKTFGKQSKQIEREVPRYTMLGQELDTQINTPVGLANALVNAWREHGLPEFIQTVTVAQPGFINVRLKDELLVEELAEILKAKEKYGQSEALAGKKILLEHTSPNPQTTIMLGHLRNNFLGMAVSRLLEMMGAKVVKDCIVNDRGVHLCRAMWGYLALGKKRVGLTKEELQNFRKVTDEQLAKAVEGFDWRDQLDVWIQKKTFWWSSKELDRKPDHANLIWYVLGSQAHKEHDWVKAQVTEILQAWENEDDAYYKRVRQLWERVMKWSEKGYAETYAKIGSKHDKYWYESDHWQKGVEWVQKGLKRGVFQESEGAVVTDLAEYGLPDTVVQKADGTALYHTQDLALTELKTKKYPSDLYVWDIGWDQKLYLQQLYAMAEQLGIAPRKKLLHLDYALINFKGGEKMATRTGHVVTADEVLELMQKRTQQIIRESDQEKRGKLTARQKDRLAEAVGLAGLKYSLLKYSRTKTIQFDIDESLNLQGDSGPYLQYTFARARSVLAKSQSYKATKLQSSYSEALKLWNSVAINSEERQLLRTLYQYSSILRQAAEGLAPNLLTTHLYQLAQEYNTFYNRHRILNPETPQRPKVPAYSTPEVEKAARGTRQFRLALTAATAQVLANGLEILGIEAVEKM